jgi:hypothetical protein
MRRMSALAIITLGLALATPAHAQFLPFTATLSNITPLAFGMTPDQAAFALGTPMTYVSGRPGNEIFVTPRHYGGSGFFPRSDPLYLQFRRGRLTGWKGFWGNRWVVYR